VKWAEQGVLLLNTTLTVAQSKPGSHFSFEWYKFTDRIIKEVNDKVSACVFILWGNDASKKAVLVDGSKHLILKSMHPSPFSALRGFFGCDHFNKANEYLKANNKGAIAWESF
ncbi:uracil-DNA glycosylase, partial [Pancytospora epiphaga]